MNQDEFVANSTLTNLNHQIVKFKEKKTWHTTSHTNENMITIRGSSQKAWLALNKSNDECCRQTCLFICLHHVVISILWQKSYREKLNPYAVIFFVLFRIHWVPYSVFILFLLLFIHSFGRLSFPHILFTFSRFIRVCSALSSILLRNWGVISYPHSYSHTITLNSGLKSHLYIKKTKKWEIEVELKLICM